MQNVPLLPHRFAHRLRSFSADRRRACVGKPSGEDLKVIALCDRLARDAERLPDAVTAEIAERCADPTYAERFERVWDMLPDVIGILLVPASATELVWWMLGQARHDLEQGTAGLDPPHARARNGIPERTADAAP